MVSLIHSCFSRSDEQTLLPHLHSLPWSFLDPTVTALLQTSLSLARTVHLSLAGLPAPGLASSGLITPPERSSSSTDLQHHFQLEIFSSFQHGVQISWLVRWAGQGQGSLWPWTGQSQVSVIPGQLDPQSSARPLEPVAGIRVALRWSRSVH